MPDSPLIFKDSGPSGGDKQVVLSGGEIELRSGGILDIQSGALTTDASTTTWSGVKTITGTLTFATGSVLNGTATAASVPVLASATTATLSDANIQTIFAKINTILGVLHSFHAATT